MFGIKFPVVKNIETKTVIADIISEVPLPATWKIKKTQDIEIFDPRNSINFSKTLSNKNVVEIRRVLRYEPESDGDHFFHIKQVVVLEVIKEYTFEEWDSVL